MQYIDHYLTIDMLRERVPDTIWIRAAGIGHKLYVKLTAGPETVELPEETEGLVQFVYEKPDGVKSDVAMNVNDFRASVVIPRAAVDTVGIVTCEIRVYDSTAGTWWTSPEFTISVQSVVYDENAQQQIESDPTVYESILGTEATRVANEEARVEAEAERAENETRRQAAIDELQDAVDGLNDDMDNVQAALATKADKNNTEITGSLSMGRIQGTTVGGGSTTLGMFCEASGAMAFAAGGMTKAAGAASHAEGFRTEALAEYTHAEGVGSVASGKNAHAEGFYTEASGDNAHAEGDNTLASGADQHVEGRLNIEDTQDKYAHIVGNGTPGGSRSNAHTIDWNGNAWFAGEVHVGGDDYDDGDKLFTESDVDEAIAEAMTAKADKNNTVITGSLSMGREEGSTVGNLSAALGHGCVASAKYSHAEGESSTAAGWGSHAEGNWTSAGTVVGDRGCHAEGCQTVAKGMYSHAEGFYCETDGNYCHAEGNTTAAKGDYTHAEGLATIARGEAQHVQGSYNIEDVDEKYAHIVGNGEDRNNRSNAYTLDWNGNAWFAGDVRVGGDDYDDGDKLITENEMDAAIAEALVDPASFVIDDALDGTSENAVQNKVIKAALDAKADAGDVPTETAGTFTPAFTAGAASSIYIKQIGKIVYISGMLTAQTDWATDMSGVHLGDISGVSGPSSSITIPVTTQDAQGNMHAGTVIIATTGYVAAMVTGTDGAMLINGFYFTA